MCNCIKFLKIYPYISNVMHLKTSPNSFFLGISLNIIIVHNLTFTPANSGNSSAATCQKLMLFGENCFCFSFHHRQCHYPGKIWKELSLWHSKQKVCCRNVPRRNFETVERQSSRSLSNGRILTHPLQHHIRHSVELFCCEVEM